MAEDVEHCGPMDVTFRGNTIDANEKYQWYSFDTTFLGSSKAAFTTDIHESGTYYVAVDSANGISELSPFNVTIHYKPIDSLIVTDNMFKIADTTSSLLIDWMINGTTVDSLTNQRAIPLSYRYHGDISVKISSNSCSVIAESPLNNLSAIKEKECKVLVYPNPAHDKLNIRLSGMEMPATIKIFDIGGQQLQHHLSPTGKHTVMDISRLKNGMYFVQIIKNNNQFITKIIKQ
jgi:hypothetical protein